MKRDTCTDIVQANKTSDGKISSVKLSNGKMVYLKSFKGNDDLIRKFIKFDNRKVDLQKARDFRNGRIYPLTIYAFYGDVYMFMADGSILKTEMPRLFNAFEDFKKALEETKNDVFERFHEKHVL